MNENSTTSSVKLRAAATDDYTAVAALLHSVSLPLEGVAEHFEHFIVMENAEKLLGVVGLEIYNSKALLRSLAVDAQYQGRGFGKLLYDAVLEKARKQNISELYLLTETAEAFFAKMGFTRIPRDTADPKVQSSVEFQSACPASAACMRLEL